MGAHRLMNYCLSGVKVPSVTTFVEGGSPGGLEVNPDRACHPEGSQSGCLGSDL
jgi:hypothetical protein